MSQRQLQRFQVMSLVEAGKMTLKKATVNKGGATFVEKMHSP